uniref:Secreted protein n=1 Tax=Globodera pallida TaxID=36090 RepID=A0A183CMC4_GLOPA
MSILPLATLLVALALNIYSLNALSRRESGLSNVETAEKKHKLNEEFNRKFGALREGCFPRPKGKGCRCTVKGLLGHDEEKRFDRDEDCLQNYAAVLDELKNKFKGLKKGCYPRPKGCLCVVGKDSAGREITERRIKETECKCQKGDRSLQCRADGA